MGPYGLPVTVCVKRPSILTTEQRQRMIVRHSQPKIEAVPLPEFVIVQKRAAYMYDCLRLPIDREIRGIIHFVYGEYEVYKDMMRFGNFSRETQHRMTIEMMEDIEMVMKRVEKYMWSRPE